VVLMLAFMPHLRPQVLDMFLLQNAALGRGYSEIGGWRQAALRLPSDLRDGGLPAGRRDIGLRFRVAQLFKDEHYFSRSGMLVEHEASGEPMFGSALILSNEYLRLSDGEVHKPDFSASFPAKLMQTKLDWSDRCSTRR
jgi:hypothetical protein